MAETILSSTQMAGLRELAAVHDDGYTWVRPQYLSGTPAERSAANFRSLMAIGLVEGQKDGSIKQGQWRWRITDEGRQVVARHEGSK